jgi:hypothetical protein
MTQTRTNTGRGTVPRFILGIRLLPCGLPMRAAAQQPFPKAPPTMTRMLSALAVILTLVETSSPEAVRDYLLANFPSLDRGTLEGRRRNRRVIIRVGGR